MSPSLGQKQLLTEGPWSFISHFSSRLWRQSHAWPYANWPSRVGQFEEPLQVGKWNKGIHVHSQNDWQYRAIPKIGFSSYGIKMKQKLTQQPGRTQQGISWQMPRSYLDSPRWYILALTWCQTKTFLPQIFCNDRTVTSGLHCPGNPVVFLTHIQFLICKSFQEKDFEELISVGQQITSLLWNRCAVCQTSSTCRYLDKYIKCAVDELVLLCLAGFN